MSESKKKDSPSREAILTFVNDLKFAIRSLGRSKGLVITVVLTLALGIGANAAIFTLVRGVLLRPLVNRDEDRLIYIQQSAPGISPGGVPFSVPEIQDLRASVKTLTSFGEFSTVGFTMIGLGEPREVRAGVVDGSYFDVVGLHPVLGRLIGPQDDGPKKLASERDEDFDAVMGLAVRLSPPPALKPLVAFTDDVPDARFGKDNAILFGGLFVLNSPELECPHRASPQLSSPTGELEG